MKLTGKCLKDFTEWNGNKQFDMMLPTEYPTYLNALIIEFFDSVGIFIFIEHTSYFSVPKFEAKIITADDFIILNRREKRSEAIQQAIINANKIYNERV